MRRKRSQYPLRWAPSSDGGNSYVTSPACLVSIPSQVGTLFGPRLRSAWSPSVRVSIPSQVGTLFGRGGSSAANGRHLGLNTLSGGHPLRTLPSSLSRTACSGLNTLSGGHPLRTAISKCGSGAPLDAYFGLFVGLERLRRPLVSHSFPSYKPPKTLGEGFGLKLAHFAADPSPVRARPPFPWSPVYH